VSIEKSHRTDWFCAAKWGVMCHFLASEPGCGQDGAAVTAEAWNRKVDGFDADRFARRLADTGAGYFLMTVGQNTGHFCAPNAAYDDIAGIRPSKCSRRDLMMDLEAALRPRSVALMAYMPCNAPMSDPVAVARFGWKPAHVDPATQKRTYQRLAGFQSKWERVIREWSERWGPAVKGWWVDGCYAPDVMYHYPDPPNFTTFAAAMRAGNKDSILGFNSGPPRLPIPVIDPEQDYTGGHSIGLGSLYASPRTRWVEHAQFHVLEYLGEKWGVGPSRFPDAFVAEYVKYITDWEGVVTLEVPIQSGGVIPDEFLRQLDAVGKRVNRP